MLFFNNLVLLLSVLGSLTLFLYGMKLMSESLQRFGGSRLRKIFASIASNRFKAIFAGLLVTGIIQSSSAVTVMLVSFINAGFFTLAQSLGIMMGANIGTTVTAWLVSYFGFHLDFNIVLIPLLGLALPLLFLPGNGKKPAGEFILGFVILFLGLQFMKNALPEVSENSPWIDFLRNHSSSGLVSVMFYAGVGMLITLIIQSSSATIALTMVLCHNGIIGYDAAAAMVIGENIGTTVTANLAAIVANRPAKRLALGHTLFNVAGSVWVIVFFGFFTSLSAKAAFLITGYYPVENAEAIPIGLSVFHTGFNLINTLLLTGFISPFAWLLQWVIPVRTNEKKNYSLKYIRSGFLSLNEISLLQAQEEVLHFGRHVSYMFNLIPEYLSEKRERKYQKLRKKLFKGEEQADFMENEIRNYLTRLVEHDHTVSGSRKISSMLKIIDDLESMADQCMLMEKTIFKKNEEKTWFTQEMRDGLTLLFNLVDESLQNMIANLAGEYRPGILAKATESELKINEYRDHLLRSNSNNLSQGVYSYTTASYFTAIVSQCEHLADHIINVNQAIATNVK